jgi:ABC-2 type transport system ATP-binding protein
MNLLTAENINKTFDAHKALSDISLEIPKGSIFGLLGPNGAGKTTFIRIINQIIGPDSGKIYIDGEKLNPSHINKIGYLPEERGLYKKMKVGEQAIYLAMLKGLTERESKKRLKQWFEKFEIIPWWDKKVEELSKGMQQKIQFIVTILHQPELLIFDEPFSGFDPINTNLLKKEILNLRDQGATIIFSTHNMESVEEICDRIALINKSKLILEGKVSEIKHGHRTNTFEVEYQPFDKKLDELLPDEFKLLSRRETKFGKIARVRIPDEKYTNKLLEILMNNSRIIRFQEVIPTMNEIFISKVNDEDNKNRSNE